MTFEVLYDVEKIVFYLDERVPLLMAAFHEIGVFCLLSLVRVHNFEKILLQFFEIRFSWLIVRADCLPAAILSTEHERLA